MTCFRSAVYPLLLTATVIVVATGKLCRLEADTGLCRAYMPQFYYNWKEQQCQEFIYGGCGGNDNRFETLAECQQRCADVCQQPKQVGPCRAAFRRWFYNRNTGMCEPFIYGGCQGNGNNFPSLPECQERCMSN